MDVLSRSSLLALRELAAFGTMRAAADVLGVTPGAVSQQLTALEERLGVAVIVRSGRGVQLTDAGRLLVEHAERILLAQDQALAAVRTLGPQAAGRVTLGLFGSSAALLPTIVQSVAAAHPGIEIRTREIDVDEALMAVRRGWVDLAFGLDYADAPIPRVADVGFTPLLVERMGIAMASGELHRRGRVDLAAGRDWDWILAPAGTHYGDAVRAACRRAGFEPRVIHEVTDTAASLALAASGQGVTPVTELMRRLVPDLPIEVQQIEQDVTRSLCLAMPGRGDVRPSVQATAELITRAVGSTTDRRAVR